MKNNFIHNIFFRIFAPPVYGVLIYLLILLINNNVGQLFTLFVNVEVYVSIALSIISFEFMRMTISWIDHTGLPFKTTIPLQLFATTALSVTFVLLAISQFYYWIIGFDISSREVILFSTLYTLTAILYNALYFGNEYLHHENTVQVEQENKLRENLESEFTSFRQEINPDLLYDSLEELILCLHRKTEVAEELIDSLAALYRYQLIHRQKEFVSLSEEVAAVNHLLRLANQKYRNQIRWSSLIDEASSIPIMPGALITTVDSIIRNTL
ncbi:MAG TPA: histidine kinase, partial [Chitinophagales bacterium]|nr:histidine kinase [Chitinophagales bacterium]